MKDAETTILSAAGVHLDDEILEAAKSRANILGLSQAAEDAVLRPKDYGSFAHDLRAAIAARVAMMGSDETLADHYLTNAGTKAALANPAETGEAYNLETIVQFVDKVANQTSDISAQDIAELQSSGVSDADIVRLCELIAFLAYQLRVVAGLRLMKRSAA